MFRETRRDGGRTGMFHLNLVISRPTSSLALSLSISSSALVVFPSRMREIDETSKAKLGVSKSLGGPGSRNRESGERKIEKWFF